ncbi:MAG TPA: carboxypeptidase-like regulatory domain-containing protein [Terriglobia bacterium]|nr:carboxypeptidase-like regulatory domain-containing protein [Terriglobia bacterium]
MDASRKKFLLSVLIISFSFSIPIYAQNSGATLSGVVSDSSGSPVADVRISVSNVFTGQAVEARTDASGRYSVSKLGPGDYEVTAVAEGFPTSQSKVTIAAGAAQTLNLQLEGTSGNNSAQGGGTEPSLSSLGFPSNEVQGNAREQARLNKRTRMLQIHQKLGMVTVAAMVAALATSAGAKGHHGLPGSPGGRNLHMAMGVTTAGLYAATAYFALAAPRMPGVHVRGPIRLHKAMAWIHGPGMVMTAVLGAMAYSQLSNGERVHGIAKYHGAAAIVTTAALGTAVMAVTLKF